MSKIDVSSLVDGKDVDGVMLYELQSSLGHAVDALLEMYGDEQDVPVALQHIISMADVTEVMYQAVSFREELENAMYSTVGAVVTLLDGDRSSTFNGTIIEVPYKRFMFISHDGDTQESVILFHPQHIVSFRASEAYSSILHITLSQWETAGYVSKYGWVQPEEARSNG